MTPTTTEDAREALERLQAGNAICGTGPCSRCRGYGGPSNPTGSCCDEKQTRDLATVEAALTRLSEAERQRDAAVAVVEAAVDYCSDDEFAEGLADMFETALFDSVAEYLATLDTKGGM